MNLIEVVILAGAQCLSPLQAADGATEVSKVPCAVLISLNKETGDVEFMPPAAATDPQVIAMLVRPGDAGGGPVVVPTAADGAAELPSRAPITSPREETTAAPKITARVVPVAKPEKTAEQRKTARVEKKPAAPSTAKKRSAARRTDVCGSYRAIWYTNKAGRKKYRCVKTG